MKQLHPSETPSVIALLAVWTIEQRALWIHTNPLILELTYTHSFITQQLLATATGQYAKKLMQSYLHLNAVLQFIAWEHFRLWSYKLCIWMTAAEKQTKCSLSNLPSFHSFDQTNSWKTMFYLSMFFSVFNRSKFQACLCWFSIFIEDHCCVWELPS